jgi:dihydroorotate dehydrogenase (NAD+) catalytic subunit
MVYESSKAVKIPIIGMGGIMCARDAVEFMLCGASAVMVGTANINRPKACLEIAEGLNQYCENNGIKKISEITGGLIV